MRIKERIARLEGAAKPEEDLMLVRIQRAGLKGAIDHSYSATVCTREEYERPFPFTPKKIRVRKGGPQELTDEGEEDLVSKLSPEDRERWQRFRARCGEKHR